MVGAVRQRWRFAAVGGGKRGGRPFDGAPFAKERRIGASRPSHEEVLRPRGDKAPLAWMDGDK
jgi:hypothetical protein